jgi:quercetin dioxygenase-like cupin family protein
MPHINDIPEKQLVPGIVGQYLHGDKCSFGWVTLKAGSQFTTHHHPHEQVTCILEGELEMIIGGVTKLLTPGMVEVIPGGVPHSAIVRKDSIVIDVFSPVREEYKAS